VSDVRAPSSPIITAPTTSEIGALYRRRSIADALAALDERDRDLVRRRQLDGTDVTSLTRNLRLEPARAAADLTSAHRRLLGGLGWLSGEGRCTDTRAALLAGTDRPDDIEHLRACPGCRTADLLGLQTELADPDAWNGAWLADLVRWEHRSHTTGGASAGAAGTSDAVPAWRRRILAVLAVAGAVVLATVAAVVVRNGDGDEGPLVASAALDGGDLAAGATGAVEVFEDDAGFRIVLRAPGLPEPPDGSFYQAWIKRGDGLVAIGTFSRGGEIVLWSGIPLVEGDLVTVTLEPDDGDPSSSGQRVLAGPVELSP
jgi:hypothetical protein